ncbi:MAG: hypothetical protein WB992_02900 [Bryobacteraceae bacterium]
MSHVGECCCDNHGTLWHFKLSVLGKMQFGQKIVVYKDYGMLARTMELVLPVYVD